MAKTISFGTGKGCLGHNNREFISDNIDRERIKNNIVLKSEKLEDAYEKIFSSSIEKYNEKQKRVDRKIKGSKDYMNRIKNSKNNENLFYENIVMIGDKYDSQVGTVGGKKVTDVLVEYAKSFQERNPNLYVFNSVIHLDESTPHLHINYVPFGTGYKKGLEKRNSLTKAFDNMGFDRGTRANNSTMAWQKKEREYLKDICNQKGIDTKELGHKRPNYKLKEYRAMSDVISRQFRFKQPQIEVEKVLLSNDKVKIEKTDLEALKREFTKARKSKNNYNKLSKEVEVLIDDLNKEKQLFLNYKRDYGLVRTENEKLLNENENLIKNQNRLIKENHNLKLEKKELSDDNKSLIKKDNILTDFVFLLEKNNFNINDLKIDDKNDIDKVVDKKLLVGYFNHIQENIVSDIDLSLTYHNNFNKFKNDEMQKIRADEKIASKNVKEVMDTLSNMYEEDKKNGLLDRLNNNKSNLSKKTSDDYSLDYFKKKIEKDYGPEL